MNTCIMKSPIGNLELKEKQGRLVEVVFCGKRKRQIHKDFKNGPLSPTLQKAKEQLEEYFTGQRKKFNLPLQIMGTDFQEKVWQQLKKVGYGESQSYSELAKGVGAPKAMRAVGSACGKNPLPIIVPCHRILSKSGTLGGFSGGLEVKAWLLEHEGILS